MDTADIEIFLTLAEELHFGRTAERMYVGQPRVSRVIAELENQAGGKLFERTTRKVRLTPLGTQLRDRLQPAYTQLQAAFDDARRASRETAGELRIGFTVLIQGEALTRLVTAFEADHRGSRVALHEVDIVTLYAALRHGQVDVLVNWLALDEPDLTTGPAIEHRDRVLAVGVTHPLARRQSIAAEELADYELTGVSQGLPAALLDAIIPPRTPSGRLTRRISAGSIQEMQTDIARGLAVHPTLADVLMLRRSDTVLVPIDGLPPLPLGLIWCTAHENARIRVLASTARRLYPRSGPPGSTQRPQRAG